jgi:hypothetical protein
MGNIKRYVPQSDVVKQLSIFGRPLLLEGEDADTYDELLARICAAVKPIDIIDEIFVYDLVCLQWEILRLRRLKTSLIRSAGSEALEEFLFEELDYDLYSENCEEELTEVLENLAKDQTEDFAQNLARLEPDAVEKVSELLDATVLRLDEILDGAKDKKAQELARAYARREPDAIEKVNELLASSGRTMDDLMAKKFATKIDYITNIERFDRLITIAETRLKASLREIYQHRAVLGEALRRNMQEIEDGEFEAIQETPAKGKKVA